MSIISGFARIAAVSGLLLAIGPAMASDRHDPAFWTSLKERNFKIPEGLSAEALSVDLLGLLSSTDPAVRDAIAYEAFEAWVYRDQLLPPDALERLRVQLMVLARIGQGEEGGDSVFGRSFAILCLSVLAAEDLRRPFLGPAAFDELWAFGLDALARERDLRGYVAGKGWAHATAHTADLLKFLARNNRLTRRQADDLVAGIDRRLASAGLVFVWGEDIRLAAALRSLIARPDFDAVAFSAWLARLRGENEALWRENFEPARYVGLRAELNMLAQLASRLRPASPDSPAALLRASIENLLLATD